MFSPHSTLFTRSPSRRRLRSWRLASLPLVLLTSSSFAFADELDDGYDVAQAADDTADQTEDGAEAEQAGETQPAREQISSPPDSAGRGSGIWEDPKETYYFAGVRYRLQVIPQFVQNWFAEGGETLIVHTPGLEFGIRQDGFEYNIFGMLGMYNMTDVPFKGNTDVELAWETITTNYKVLFLGSDFMWSTPEFTPGLSAVYGAGIGLGLVFGDMQRTQAYPDGNGSYVPCADTFNPFVPGPVSEPGQYCDDVNNHYNGYVEPSWANGGASPLIFPWIAGQVGLRYKAHKNFVARLDAGYSIASFFVGLGADYGL